MKDLIEKLLILEDECKNNTIEVEHLFEAPEDSTNNQGQLDQNNQQQMKINAQTLKILSEKINVDPNALRVTLSKILRNQIVDRNGREQILELVKLLIKQQPALLNRMK